MKKEKEYTYKNRDGSYIKVNENGVIIDAKGINSLVWRTILEDIDKKVIGMTVWDLYELFKKREAFSSTHRNFETVVKYHEGLLEARDGKLSSKDKTYKKKNNTNNDFCIKVSEDGIITYAEGLNYLGWQTISENYDALMIGKNVTELYAYLKKCDEVLKRTHSYGFKNIVSYYDGIREGKRLNKGLVRGNK